MERVLQILSEVQRSRGRPIQRSLWDCFVCGKRAPYEREEKRFCGLVCHAAEFGFSKLFPLGMKRLLDVDRVEQSIWFQDLPLEILGEIILMVFDYRIMSKKEWNWLVGLSKYFDIDPDDKKKGTVLKLVAVIKTKVIPGLRFVAPKVLEVQPFMTLGFLVGLTRLDMPLNRLDMWTPFLARMKHLRFLDMSIYNYQSRSVYLPYLTHITKLRLHHEAGDNIIKDLTHITNLSLVENKKVTMQTLVQLTQLTTLDLTECEASMGDAVFGNLSNLTKLSLQGNSEVFEYDLLHLVNLTKLNIKSSMVDDEALSRLTGLQILYIDAHSIISNKTLGSMTRLNSLRIHGDSEKEGLDLAVGSLTNLTKLSLTGGATVFRQGDISGYSPSPKVKHTLSSLPQLTHLNLKKNTFVSDQDLLHLTGLQLLDISVRSNITNEPLKRMTNLRRLNIIDNDHITPEIIPFLPELQEIRLSFEQYKSKGFSEMEKSLYLNVYFY